MRLRNITLAGMVLLLLAFTTIAGATDQNTTENETQDVNVTGTSNETLNVTPTNQTDNETQDVNVTGGSTETLIVPPTEETDDEVSAQGIFASGVLYRLKIAFDNIGETFIFNESEKLGRQVSNARHRINEARAALKRNDIEAADIALAEYGAKMNKVKNSMSKLSDKDTGFLNARNMTLKHQLILNNLSMSYPNNTGLQKAYNNSENLQTKFASKKGQKSDLNSARENLGTSKSEKTAATVNDDKPDKGKKDRR